MNSKKIIILLATYNGEAFISAQLESILSQTNTDWELLIHDDNSTDRTVEILREYTQKFSDKITFIDDTISLKSAKKNFSYLLEKVKTANTYIMFADQDDIWHQDKIEVTLQKMFTIEKENPDIPVLVHTDLVVTDEKLTPVASSFWKYAKIDPSKSSLAKILMQNSITGCTVMINPLLVQKSVPIPDEAIMHDWWLGLVAAKFGKIGWIDRATMLYRQHSSNDTGAKPFNIRTVIHKILAYSDKTLLQETLKRNFIQAQVFLERYRSELTENEIDMLEQFSQLEKKNFFEKRFILLKYGLLKYGFIRNIGLLGRI